MVKAEEYRDTALIGMKMICQCVDRSEATVLKLIRDEGFPAVKIGGIWESDRGLIASWRKIKISAGQKQAVS